MPVDGGHVPMAVMMQPIYVWIIVHWSVAAVVLSGAGDVWCMSPKDLFCVLWSVHPLIFLET